MVTWVWGLSVFPVGPMDMAVRTGRDSSEEGAQQKATRG
jgi:hypothetical protein